MSWKRTGVMLAVAAMMMPMVLRAQEASLWLTTPDRSSLLKLQSPAIAFGGEAASGMVIDVDDTKRFQTMDGFGFALTGGSAQLIAKMDADKRAALLKELFTTEGDGIGVSYLRVSVGASDMNDHVYSYDDLPKGETDVKMEKFSLEPDKADVIPVLKEILAINPKIKILASPWSAPLWMKTTGVARGGVLKPEYFDAYALYWVKYIEGMKAEGITIDALTVENEPLNEKNTPSMLMLESEQADFIANHLGPAFKKAGIRTKIVLYDHNLDHPAYPLAILKDKKANKYVDGTGFHLYGGTVEAFDQVHDAFPKKNLYFTEQSVTERPGGDGGMNVAKPVARIVIGATRHWSRNVLLWNLAADPQAGPHTNEGGCTGCYGALTIDGNNVTRLVAYYVIAHVSKFVPDGSVRIGSEPSEALPNVAFRTPQGKTLLLVANTGTSSAEFSVRFHGKTLKTSLGAGAVGTYVW
ncbi:glycoside hydrolase family 30 protein [Edaphobacter aggregans]|uniref:glycoside hydrolase family 30 protein n=1 Tax=Edaphobacter aggregans TaxID=570835 RepID=UPI000552DBF0|nr:glycoside hydrolase family 30 beta sandwich domain-containing protein [Edaphobacter aggregans]